MADISLVIEVQGQQAIEDATNQTLQLEGRIKGLSSAMQKGNITQKQFAAGIGEIADKYNGLEGKISVSENAIKEFARSLTGASASIENSVSTTQKLQSRVTSLRQAYADGLISTRQFNAGLTQISQGLANQYGSFERAQRAVFAFNDSLKIHNMTVERSMAATSAWQGRVKGLYNALKAGDLSLDEFNRGLLEIRRSIDGQFPSWQKAQAAVRAYATELEMANKTDEVERARAAYQRLAASLDPVVRATQQYQRSLQTLDAARDAEVIGVVEYNRQLNLLNRGYIQATGGANLLNNSQRQMAAGMNLSSNAINQFGIQASRAQVKTKRFASVGLQQVGYQVGDFAVQVQGGTNVAVAFGQQMSQLLGIFGAGGALAGAAVAISTAFIAPLMRAKDAVEDFRVTADSAFSKYTSAVDKATKATEGIYNAEKARLDLSLNNADALLTNLRIEATLREKLAEIEARRLRISAEKLRMSIKERQEKVRELFESEMVGVGPTIELENAEFVPDTRFLEGMQAAMARVREENEEFLLELQEDVVQLELLELLINSTSDGLINNTEGANSLGDALSGVVEKARAFRDVLFETQSLYFSVRFRSEEDLMGQEVKPSEGKLNPGKTWDEMIALGWSPENLKNIGMTPPSKGRGGGRSRDNRSDIEKLQEQLDLELAILQADEDRAYLLEKLGIDYDKVYGQAAIDKILATKDAIDAVTEAQQRSQDIADSMEGAFSDFFNSLVDGTTTVEEAFKDMARSILQQLWDILVVQQIVGSWSPESGGTGIVGGIMNFFRQANGNAFMGGNVIPFANGGIVNSPTLFPMANGMGLMGEAGPEAVMPLKRGKDGKLGVQAEGGGGDTFVIHQNFNFSANGDESVKRIIAQSAPEISKLTQRDILETRRRGGTFKAAFG